MGPYSKSTLFRMQYSWRRFAIEGQYAALVLEEDNRDGYHVCTICATVRTRAILDQKMEG